MEQAIELLRMILAEMKVQTTILESFANAPKPDPKQTMEEAMKLVNAAGIGAILSRANQESGR
jgi:hypothetical protein